MIDPERDSCPIQHSPFVSLDNLEPINGAHKWCQDLLDGLSVRFLGQPDIPGVATQRPDRMCSISP